MSEQVFESITAKEFHEKIVKSGANAVVKVTTSWSGASMIVTPILEEMAAQYKGRVQFFSIDQDNDTSFGNRFDVTAFPTLLFFKRGVLVDKLSGVFHKASLFNSIQLLVENY